MRFFIEKYRSLSVWLSLAIIAMAFVAGSADSNTSCCITAAFLTGAVMYGIGGAREWSLGRRTFCWIHELWATALLACAVWYQLEMRGIL